jgi:GNAT superfamily N-acetyltransferase
MKQSVWCRKANKEDLPAVLRLYAQLEMDDGNALSLSEAEHLFDKFTCYPDYNIYVAVYSDQIIGSFELLIMDNLGHLGAPSAVIEDVVVDPKWQGHGVRKMMMQEAIKICNGKGCYKTVLSSNLKRSRAHAFYESLGFKRHGYSYYVSGQQGA